MPSPQRAHLCRVANHTHTRQQQTKQATAKCQSFCYSDLTWTLRWEQRSSAMISQLWNCPDWGDGEMKQCQANVQKNGGLSGLCTLINNAAEA